MRFAGLFVALLVAISVAIGVVVLVMGSSSGTPWVELDVGDCFDLDAALSDAEADGVIVRVDPLPCSEPHDAEVVAVGELNPDGELELPPDDALTAGVDRRCAEAVGDRIDSGRFAVLPVAPDEPTWRRLAGRYACIAVPIGGVAVTGSAIAAGT